MDVSLVCHAAYRGSIQLLIILSWFFIRVLGSIKRNQTWYYFRVLVFQWSRMWKERKILATWEEILRKAWNGKLKKNSLQWMVGDHCKPREQCDQDGLSSFIQTFALETDDHTRFKTISLLTFYELETWLTSRFATRTPSTTDGAHFELQLKRPRCRDSIQSQQPELR